MVRDLCGTFCFSMQFVIFMELLGACMLPAAICLFVYLIVMTVLAPTFSIVPLVMIGVALFLPALLVLLTSPFRHWSFLFWMIIYLISLPIWQFILPVYAYWHFDDFSWGETRKVAGGVKDDSHGDQEVIS